MLLSESKPGQSGDASLPKKIQSTCSRQISWRVGCLFAMVVLTGCQTIQPGAKFPWEKTAKFEMPEKIMAVWTEAVQHQDGKVAQRGFGGRIFFYDKQEQPVKVDGTVMIYVFDNEDVDTGSYSPQKKFVFLGETLASHYSKCSLGHSYSFWIPLGPVGGASNNLSLVARLDGTNGGSVVSSMTRKFLPGVTPPNTTDVAIPTNRMLNSVKQVQYLEPESTATESNNQSKTDIISHTIDLTPSFSKRLQLIGSAEPAGVASESTQPNGNKTVILPNVSISPTRDESSTHFELPKSQAPSTPSFPPAESLPRRQPHRAEWLSGLPPTPRSGFRSAKKMPDQSESELARKAAQYFQSQGQNPIQEPARTEY